MGGGGQSLGSGFGAYVRPGLRVAALDGLVFIGFTGLERDGCSRCVKIRVEDVAAGSHKGSQSTRSPNTGSKPSPQQNLTLIGMRIPYYNYPGPASTVLCDVSLLSWVCP